LYKLNEIDETDSKQPKSIGKFIPAYGFLKSQEKNPRTKSLRLLLNVCYFQKENHALGYGFKNI
jgi:hypothetical protein